MPALPGAAKRSEVVEEGDDGIGRSVAAGTAGWRRNPVEGALLEFELRRANEILKAVSVFFATELDADRPK